MFICNEIPEVSASFPDRHQNKSKSAKVNLMFVRNVFRCLYSDINVIKAKFTSFYLAF